MCVMHHSVNNLQENLESLHACGCRQLFNSLFLKKKKKQGVQRVSLLKALLLNLLWHISSWLLHFSICFLGCLFQAFLNQAFVLSLIFFPYCFFLLSIASFNLLSLSSTLLPPRGQSQSWGLLIVFYETIANLVQEIGISLSSIVKKVKNKKK